MQPTTKTECRILQLEHPDLLADPQAQWVVKNEVVLVEFADAIGIVQSAVGINAYAARDALLTGSTGDRWCVSRARFDSKYRPEGSTIAGLAGHYRNLPTPIRAKQMTLDFRIARCIGGDLLHGVCHDWLMQYAPGDYGIVARARFDRVYEIASAPALVENSR